MSKEKWAVVENAGYDGEAIRKTFDGYTAACTWLGRHYLTEEREELHVAVARIAESGELTYDY